MATKNKNRPKFLDDVTYLPNEEYEFGIVADKPGKSKNKQFGQRVYAARRPRLTPEQWQEYWGNQGATAVNNARDNFAKTVMPYALGFINPEGLLTTLGGIAGETAGGYIGNKIGGTKGETIGSILGGMAGGVGSTRYPYDISRNIKNRNLFAYRYIDPFGYELPIRRGMQMIKHIITDENLPNVSTIPRRDIIVGLGSLNDATRRFRDVAWRKYLGLPELDDLYIPNGDGTWSYNLNTVKRISGLKEIKPSYITDRGGVTYDYITGNGGNVKSTIRELGKRNIANGKTNRFAIQTLEDVWDLHPFRINTKLKAPIIPYIQRLGDNVLDYLGSNDNNISKIIGKLNLGKPLSKFVHADFDSKYTKLRKLLNPLQNVEMGDLLKGKPFTMKTNIPFTELYDPTNPYLRGSNYVEGINGL